MDKKQISVISTNVNHNEVKVKRRKGKEINSLSPMLGKSSLPLYPRNIAGNVWLSFPLRVLLAGQLD